MFTRESAAAAARMTIYRRPATQSVRSIVERSRGTTGSAVISAGLSNELARRRTAPGVVCAGSSRDTLSCLLSIQLQLQLPAAPGTPPWAHPRVCYRTTAIDTVPHYKLRLIWFFVAAAAPAAAAAGRLYEDVVYIAHSLNLAKNWGYRGWGEAEGERATAYGPSLLLLPTFVSIFQYLDIRAAESHDPPCPPSVPLEDRTLALHWKTFSVVSTLKTENTV